MLSAQYSFKENEEAAKVKNRAENIQLIKQLSLIHQQKHEEMTVINNKRKKIAKKNEKLRCATTSTIKRETPEVIMYETHTPGFCYRCNGEQKIPNVPLTTVTIDYNCLRDLVFTDDTLDIEKILVLHLISVHKSETLTPVRDLKLASVYKDSSPTARLLEKSRKLGFVVNKTMMDLLPFYTIEIKEKPTSPNQSTKISTNRKNILAHRILFNENLRKLISTVVAVLHSSNFPKFRQLIQLAHDPNAIRLIFEKPNIIEFIEFLSEQQIVNSCENFVLTPPFKLKTRDFNVQTVTETLENFLKNLRDNVLQLPNRGNRINNEVEENDNKRLFERVKRKFSEVMSGNDLPRYPKSSKTTDLDEVEVLPQYRRSSRGSDIPDFVSKNIEAAGKTRKLEYDMEDEHICSSLNNNNNSRRRRSVSNSTSKKGLSPSMKYMPLSKLDEDIDNPETTDNSSDRKDDKTPPKISLGASQDKGIDESTEAGYKALTRADYRSKHDPLDKGYGKYNIKITTCKACMEKWRQPLPTPKTPRVKKSSVLPELNNQLYKTDSKHRIDMLINKELYTLESYDRRFSSGGSSKRPSKNETQTDSYDNININPMYLAKIEQEIRTKETQKKLEKFLKEPI
ncbi:uncharacterized protein LOC130902111 [Diorhabda carinulata]|uniref:uncharacterized protein LOC130902111 n=1 Tax=Diorhabda carinulata TaxID=1163345 RepID=UPI0025A15D26|nr:uncharacterized protein LOC130902111 [Diorhabda carinulata]